MASRIPGWGCWEEHTPSAAAGSWAGIGLSATYVCPLLFFFNLKKKFILFIYLFRLCWVCVAVHRLSLVAASGGYSSLQCAGFSLRWLLLLRSTGSRHVASVVVACGLSSCGLRALERRLSSCGLRALEHRLSSCGARA